jgi:hypothetical protein
METWLIDTTAALDIDAQIVAALRPRADDLTGGGIALNLGILGANGQVYRVARAWDLGEYQRACAALERLGLVVTGRGQHLHDISLEELFDLGDAAVLRASRRHAPMAAATDPALEPPSFG